MSLGYLKKQEGIAGLKKGLEKVGIKGLTDRMSNHELDAVTCAYVGKFFLEGKAVIYGDSDQAIVMPQGAETR